MEVISDIFSFTSCYTSDIYSRHIVNEQTLYITSFRVIKVLNNPLYSMYVTVRNTNILSNFIIYIYYVANIICNSKYIVYCVCKGEAIHNYDNIQYIMHCMRTDHGCIGNNKYNGIRYSIDFRYYACYSNCEDVEPNDINIILDQYENILDYKSELETLTFENLIELMLKANFDYPESIKNYDFVKMSKIDKCGYYVKK